MCSVTDYSEISRKLILKTPDFNPLVSKLRCKNLCNVTP